MRKVREIRWKNRNWLKETLPNIRAFAMPPSGRHVACALSLYDIADLFPGPMKEFEFKCNTCGETHRGLPALGSPAPIYFYMQDEESKTQTELTTDTCVIPGDDGASHYFVRGSLVLPVIGYEDEFHFGAWVSLSEPNFSRFLEIYDQQIRSSEPPMVGWFSTWIQTFEETEKLIARIHFQDNGFSTAHRT